MRELAEVAVTFVIALVALWVAAIAVLMRRLRLGA
jgi:uncharacterized membrane protein YhaH (DUF805 family)